jgi:hypothetical protein
MMGIFDEIKGDAVKSAAMLGGVLAFVAVIWLISISIWLLIAAIVLVAGGFLTFKYYKK